MELLITLARLWHIGVEKVAPGTWDLDMEKIF